MDDTITSLLATLPVGNNGKPPTTGKRIMTIHERNNVQTAKLKLKIAKLELTISELTETNNCYERLNDRLTAMLDDATERITRLQEIIDDHETRYENFVERFATKQTPETETTDDLILSPQETEPFNPMLVW